MSQFVNYNKRDVTLPKGCKDLIDLLATRRPLELRPPGDLAGVDLSKAITRGGTATGRLSEMGKYVKMAWKSRAFSYYLTVSRTDIAVSFNVHLSAYQMNVQDLSASVDVTMGTVQETAVRGFFERHGLELPDDPTIPSFFSPNLPVRLLCNIHPMPSEPGPLSILAVDLFREVCGFGYESTLCYSHSEVFDPDKNA